MECVLRSFAHCINVNPDKLVKYLGHNGREKVCPELPEPYCYRGFNTFELARILLIYGYSTTHILKSDIIFNSKMKEPLIDKSVDHIERFLDWPSYCLYDAGHMIGVRHGIICDITNSYTRVSDFDYQGMYIIEQILK